MANFSSDQKYLDKYGLSLFWDKVRQYIQNQIGGIDGTDVKLYPSGETNPTVTDQIEKLWNSIGSVELEGGISGSIEAILDQYVKDIQHADSQTTPLKVVVNEGTGDKADFYTVTLEDNGLANTLSDLTSNRVSSLTPKNGGGSVTLTVDKNKGEVTLTINSQELTNKVTGLENTIDGMVKTVNKAKNEDGDDIDGTYVKLNIDSTTGDVKLSINDQSLVSELTSIKNNLVLIPGSGEGTGMMSHGSSEVDGDYSVSFGYHSFNRGLISLTSGSKTEANADLTHAEGYDTKAGRMADIIDINSCTIDLVKASTRKAEIAELLNIAVEEGLISYDGVFDESNVLDYITNNHDTVIRYFGIGAHVEGKESQALGTASHAEGELTQAEGNASHAEGKNTIASGHESHAEGQDTRARGHQSHAEGIATVASGTNAHAEGDSTRASGYASHAEGISTIASGTNTHAEGELTQAIGNDSHAEGYGTQATGNQSHAEGDTTQAIGNDSHAGGNGSIAEGDRSFAHGDAVQAKGANALALGKNSIAGGHNSIAAGHESQTNNTRSFAMGYICSTGGNDSMSFGYECSTGAAKSAAIGNRAKTTNIGEFACGNYNATSDTQLFSVGCGTNNTNRKNAFHVINNSGTIKAYVDNKEISVVGHTHNPSDLGLSGAMKYCGKTTTTLSDGDTTNPIVIDGSNFTAVAGNVVIDNNNHKEFIWDGSKWELLGDEGSYKIKQSIVNDPTASGTSTTFIDTISQDVNGKITVTKKNIPSIGEMNVQSDWSETDTNSDAYIKNKPTIPTNTSQLTNNNQTFIGRTDFIISNTDADNFTDSGAYLFQTGNGENNTNFPITGYGILNVFNSPFSNRTTNYIGQLLLGTYSIFYRTKVDTWSVWKQIALTSDIPTKLSQLTDDVVDGKYLPITGGIINTAATTPLNIKNTQSNPTEVGIRFMYNNDSKAWIGYNTQNGTTLFTYNGNHRLGIKDDGTAYVDSNTLIHSGNIKDQYVAGVYDSYNPLMKITFNYAGDAITSNPTWLACWNGYTLSYVSPDNVKAGRATKLQTPRKLWGQSFDGTSDVNGGMNVDGDFFIEHSTTGRQLNIHPNRTILGYNNQFIGNPTYVDGRDVYIRYGNDEYTSVFASNGNVGIGNTSPTEKLDVAGNVKANGFIKSSSSDSYVLLGGGGHKSLSDFSKASYKTFTPAETALTNADVLSTTGEFSLAKGTWYYAGNGYLPAGEFGNIDLAGCSVLTFGGNSGGAYTQLFITSPATMGSNAVKANEILFYNNHGESYNPGWTRVLTNRNYTEYIPTSLPWSSITSKPTFATVATSGSYNDLTNKPTIPTIPSSLPSNGIINAYSTYGTNAAISISQAIRFDTIMGEDLLGSGKSTGYNNAILSISRFNNDQYTTQLGFSGNGIYARIFNAKTPDTTTPWRTMIMDDGAGKVTAKAFYIDSDERLKTFGEDIKVDFDELAKLRKSHFVFNNNPTKQEIGVSAQEVQKIYPEIVNETEEGTLSVDYSKLAVVALAAIDKLNQRVQELENKLSKYE